MDFDREAIRQKLTSFRIFNVRTDEVFVFGTKRIHASEVMIPVKERIILGCMDERKIVALIDPKTGQKLDYSGFSVGRAAGATLGLVDAIRNVRVTILREQILKALSENGVVATNHIDTHAKEGEYTGCGHGALRAMAESGSLFDRPAVDLVWRMSGFEETGTLRMVLDGEHTAQGFLVNPLSNKVLDPTSTFAMNSFFSLDLGIYREVLRWIQGALGFGDEVLQSILVKLTRNTLADVFILSNAKITEAVYIERGDDADSFFAGVLHEALAELKEREGPVLRMMEERAGMGV